MQADLRERSRPWWIFAWFAVYLLLAAILPAADDEVYYWCWSKDLQWSYFDHPPMTAVLIRLSTMVFGNTVFAIRFFSCCASAFVLFVIDRLTPVKLFVAGIALGPLFTLGAVLMTPDSPLILFWAAYLWWLVELHRRLTPNNGERDIDSETARSRSSEVLLETPRAGLSFWFLGGVLLGLGVLSKYTMGLAVPTAFISLLLTRRSWLDWLPGYVLHGIVSFLVASPILIYNIGLQFEPLRFQWEHAAQKTPSSLLSLGDFVGIQMLLFGTAPFVLVPWVCWNFRRLCQEPRLRACACLYLLPLVFFIYKSTQTRLEGNWALVAFISFWPIASDWYTSVPRSPGWRWWVGAGFIPPVAVVMFLIAHLITPLPVVPVKGDRITRQIALNEAIREIGKTIHQQEALPVYTNSYQMTALLKFQSLDARQLYDETTRASHFTRPPRRLTDVDRAYVVAEQPLADKFTHGFLPPKSIASFPISFRGTTDRTLHVWLYSKEPMTAAARR